MTIDTDRLIVEVRKHVVLWDLTDANYYDRDVKQSAWLKVAKALIPDFDKLEQKLKEQTLKNIHQRWKSARDQYTRYKSSAAKKKSGSTPKRKNKYLFAHLLSFLDPVQNFDGVQLDSPNSNHCQDEPEKIPIPRRKNKSKEKTSFEKSFESRNQTNLELDEDLAFFYSILPTVRSLNFENKFSFRSQVLQLLMGIKTTEMSNPIPHCTTSYDPNVTIPSTSTGTNIKREKKRIKESTSGSATSTDTDE